MGANMDTSITIRTNQELSAQIKALAASMDRSRNWVIENALRDYVENQSWQVEGIKKAVQSLDNGLGINHDAVTKEIDIILSPRRKK